MSSCSLSIFTNTLFYYHYAQLLLPSYHKHCTSQGPGLAVQSSLAVQRPGSVCHLAWCTRAVECWPSDHQIQNKKPRIFQSKVPFLLQYSRTSLVPSSQKRTHLGEMASPGVQNYSGHSHLSCGTLMCQMIWNVVGTRDDMYLLRGASTWVTLYSLVTRLLWIYQFTFQWLVSELQCVIPRVPENQLVGLQGTSVLNIQTTHQPVLKSLPFPCHLKISIHKKGLDTM